MFEIPDSKLFMDTVHGYINIPQTFVNHIIDTVWFQRLRLVDQTGMKILYPNGKHDRFSHSLGVYHLGLKAVNAILQDIERTKEQSYWNVRSDNTCNVFWAKNKVLFLIACLLHDIGHAPFSHALENILLNNSRNLTFYLASVINKLEKLDEKHANFVKTIKAAPHEQMGALLVIEQFKKPISEILHELNEKNYPIVSRQVYAEYANPEPSIDSSTIDEDISFIARMIIGYKYGNFDPESQIKNCFIELLNGRDFDVDKLDYIVRDTKMSGICNTSLDIERLIKSLVLVTTTKYRDFYFNEKSGELNEQKFFIKKLETTADCELEIDGDIDAAFLLEGDAEVLIFPNEKILSLKAASDILEDKRNKSKLIPKSRVEFSKDSIIYLDKNETPLKPNDFFQESISWAGSEGNEHDVIIKNATVINNPFKFKVSSEGILELTIKGHCHLIFKGIVKASSVFFKGRLKGKCKKMTIAGDLLKQQQKVPSQSTYNEFTIGFKKQAINIISNVLDARDYLYLWIYAQHKVVYYANFLLPMLSREVSRIAEMNSFPCWSLDYDNLKFVDDAYMITAMKYIAYMKNKEVCPSIIQLFHELFQRKYKNSLYKSLPEYDILFSGFTVSEQLDIRNLLPKLSDGIKDISKEEMTFGFFNENSLKEIMDKDFDSSFELVWVDASYKTKKLIFEETYCIFNEETVTMKNIDLLSKPLKHRQTSQYFYLYYSINNKDKYSLIKNRIIDYFSNKIKPSDNSRNIISQFKVAQGSRSSKTSLGKIKRHSKHKTKMKVIYSGDALSNKS